jgi:predicted RNA-binding protein with PIN domain
MWLIVDGYNVIRQWPELAMLDRADLQAGREGLLAELQAYRRVKGHRVTVVFDGREEGGFSETAAQAGGIAVRYSKRGETADTVIARLSAEGGEGAVVVSSDREVLAAARRHGAGALPGDEFIARLEQSRIASVKGDEEDERPVKSRKGVARRLPKTVRRQERKLKGI